jgi:hypothetical protein
MEMTMTKQEIFDKVCIHLFAQKVAAWGERGDEGIGCCYRDEAGNKCAVGVMIPDYAYRDAFEGVGAFTVISKLRRDGVDMDWMQHPRLMCQLQEIHDSHMPREDDGAYGTRIRNLHVVAQALNDLALQHGLLLPAITRTYLPEPKQ